MARPYDALVQKLLLPDDILQLVQPPFTDLGCPLAQESTKDFALQELKYFGSTCNGKNVVLLHLAADVIADPANIMDVLNIAFIFSTSSIAIFFFAPVKDLDRKYIRQVPMTLMQRFNNLAVLQFYDQQDIDLFNAQTEKDRPDYVKLVLGLDKLYGSNGSGPTPPKPPDLSAIRARVSEILYDRYKSEGTTPTVFFKETVINLDWPPGWNWEPPGDGQASATDLVSFLIRQGTYPASSSMKGYRPLGALLKHLIESAGGETANEIYHMIADNKLIDLEDVMAQLKKDYCKDK